MSGIDHCPGRSGQGLEGCQRELTKALGVTLEGGSIGLGYRPGDPPVSGGKAQAKGLAAIVFTTVQCCIKSGALYVYDQQELANILQAWTEVPQLHEFPTDPHQFVVRIAAEWFESTHPIYSAIAAAFGEKRACPVVVVLNLGVGLGLKDGTMTVC